MEPTPESGQFFLLCFNSDLCAVFPLNSWEVRRRFCRFREGHACSSRFGLMAANEKIGVAFWVMFTGLTDYPK